MTNLLEETREEIASNKHTLAQVAWVGSRSGKYAISWEAFEEIANIEYDSGYGGQKVANDLVVVFTDGSWLERSEYDGSEWWSYCKTPMPESDATPFKTVKSGESWASILEMNLPEVIEVDDDE